MTDYSMDTSEEKPFTKEYYEPLEDGEFIETQITENETEAKTKLNKYVRSVCPGYSVLKSINKITESKIAVIE